MKRILAVLLSAALLLGLLPACNPQGARPSEEPSDQPTASAPAEDGALSCAQIVTGVLQAMDMEERVTELYGAGDEEPERLPAYMEETYGLSEGEWEDAYVARKDASSGLEITVVRCADEEAAAHALECLTEYSVRRQGDFDTKTLSENIQRLLVVRGSLLCRGEYAAMLACYGSDYAAQIFTRIVDMGEGPEAKAELDWQMDMLLATCEAQGDDVSNVERIDSGDTDRLRSVIEEEYGLTDCPWEGAVLARGTGSSVFELAVLRFADERTAQAAVGVLGEYLDAKEEAYARFPAQAKLLYEASVRMPESTLCVILAVSVDPDWPAFELASYLTDGRFRSYYGAPRHWDPTKTPSVERDPNYPDRVKFTPPNEEDMSLYDTSAIRAAWAADDPAGLSDADLAVYDAAKEILGEILRDGMTDLEKEKAIYRWVVDNVNYDWSHVDIMTETPRTAYEPYGALVDRVAVCLGYAAGFQLLMDLAGVECITVVGAYSNSTGDHAWNMVRLDGNWYCVDVTWDANARELEGEGHEWMYFNVTSDEMARSHQWDYANTPEAVE